MKPGRTTSQLAGLALFSGSSLYLEIALTRLLATIYYPPYVFAAISLAILGIGLGAALASWQTALRRETLISSYMGLAGLGGLILVAFAVLTAAYDLQPGTVVRGQGKNRSQCQSDKQIGQCG